MFHRLKASFTPSIIVAIVASSLFACGPAAAVGEEAILLEQHILKDPGSRNMKSHSILAPKGWKVKGGGFWMNAKYFRVHPSQEVTITGPEGQYVLIAPMLAATDIYLSQQMVQQGVKRPAEGTEDSGKPVVYMPQTLEQWGEWIKTRGIEAPHPKAKNIKIEPVVVIPELTQFLKKHAIEPIKRQQAEAARQIGNTGAFADGAGFVAWATYEVDGQKWEQLWVWALVYTGHDSTIGRQVFWIMEPNVTFRAREGKLMEQMPLMMTVVNSLRMTPEWARMKAKHIARMDQIDEEGFVKRAETQAQFSNDMRQIITETGRNTQAMRDKGHERFIKGMLEIESYVERDSNRPGVELPMHYKHVWRSEDGSIYLTNNANDDPRTGSRETWRQMERANP